MLDKWRYKRQNKGVLNTKKRGVLNAKKWCVKRQFRRFRCQNLFLKLTPGKQNCTRHFHIAHLNEQSSFSSKLT